MTRYEWDPAKAASNYAKHRIHFADAVGVFEDELAITIDDTSTAEERLKTLGIDFRGRLVVVVYTYRGDTILISARKATAAQRAVYERKRR
jgi:uncharacterized protein